MEPKQRSSHSRFPSDGPSYDRLDDFLEVRAGPFVELRVEITPLCFVRETQRSYRKERKNNQVTRELSHSVSSFLQVNKLLF